MNWSPRLGALRPVAGTERVRRSEFRALIADEFGEGYGETIVRDQALMEFSDRTAEQALRDGEEPKRVWLAICVQMQVDRSRWAGRPQRVVRSQR